MSPERRTNTVPVCFAAVCSAATPIRCHRRHGSGGDHRSYRASCYLTRVKRLFEFRETSKDDDLSAACGKAEAVPGRHVEDASDPITTGIVCSPFAAPTSFSAVIACPDCHSPRREGQGFASRLNQQLSMIRQVGRHRGAQTEVLDIECPGTTAGSPSEKTRSRETTRITASSYSSGNIK